MDILNEISINNLLGISTDIHAVRKCKNYLIVYVIKQLSSKALIHIERSRVNKGSNEINSTSSKRMPLSNLKESEFCKCVNITEYHDIHSNYWDSYRIYNNAG